MRPEFLMTSVFHIHFLFFFFLSAVGLHENVYTNITHTLTLLHTLIMPALAAHGKEYTTAFIKVWVTAHPQHTATDVAFTTKYG